ncbi:hypothetical protein Dda_6351 [Drechslerella dactyloides]|uniref:Uncharacterized protein n=1 Tax=Drechslerella dactyloides TaxID=74499 RepID=A0AAD6NG55_DREDA|nr:hypothetical protein Dda_6351 [Drechslerella dactyloides]
MSASTITETRLHYDDGSSCASDLSSLQISAAQRALLIPELLESILVFVSPLRYNKEVVEAKRCSDADTFKDLWASCRMVSHRWKAVIESSPTLCRNRYLVQILPEEEGKNSQEEGKNTQESEAQNDASSDPMSETSSEPPDDHAAYPTDTSRMRPQPIAIFASIESPRIAFCAPFISWLARRLHFIGRNAVGELPKLESIRDLFLQQQFPQMYITYPPVVEINVSCDREFEVPVIAWHQGITATLSPPANFEYTLRRLPSDDVVIPRIPGVLVCNEFGVTVNDVIEALCVLFKITTALHAKGWRQVSDDGAQHSILDWIEIGVFHRFDEKDPDGAFGVTRQVARAHVRNREKWVEREITPYTKGADAQVSQGDTADGGEGESTASTPDEEAESEDHQQVDQEEEEGVESIDGEEGEDDGDWDVEYDREDTASPDIMTEHIEYADEHDNPW